MVYIVRVVVTPVAVAAAVATQAFIVALPRLQLRPVAAAVAARAFREAVEPVAAAVVLAALAARRWDMLAAVVAGHKAAAEAAAQIAAAMTVQTGLLWPVEQVPTDDQATVMTEVVHPGGLKVARTAVRQTSTRRVPAVAVVEVDITAVAVVPRQEAIVLMPAAAVVAARATPTPAQPALRILQVADRRRVIPATHTEVTLATEVAVAPVLVTEAAAQTVS